MKAGGAGGDHGFSALEVNLLVKMYQNLAANSPGKTINKSMFLKFFPLPGLFGERLFNLFDTKRTNVIDYEEFVQGCSRVAGGNEQGKMQFFFHLYDLNDDKCITRPEMEAILRHVPVNVLAIPAGTESLSNTEKLKAVCDLEFPDDGSVMAYDKFEGFISRQPGMRECVCVVCCVTAILSFGSRCNVSPAFNELLKFECLQPQYEILIGTS